MAFDNPPWNPITDPVLLAKLGKLSEELGELQQMVARVIIQGLDELEPRTGKPNRIALAEEIVDVGVAISFVDELVGSPILSKGENGRQRYNRKQAHLTQWHERIAGDQL